MSLQNTWNLIFGLLVAVFGYLAYAVSPVFALVNLILGLVLVQSVFTGFCPLKVILKALGLR